MLDVSGRRCVLTIAASDPCGGAGIQADLRVIASLGLAGWSAITALTVQNTLGVHSVQPIDANILERQVRTLFEDAAPSAIKIGLLPSAAAVRAVARALTPCPGVPIVLDPVLHSTGGVPFLDCAGRERLLDELIPLCTLITPNIPELADLTGLSVDSAAQRETAAHNLQERGSAAVLIKGGHISGNPEDVLVERSGQAQFFRGPRIQTPHTHGTGCFLSSAIACRLALGESLAEACSAARTMIQAGLEAPIVWGSGRGSPDPFAGLPLSDASRSHGDRLKKLRGLYVLTDAALQHGRSHEEVARAAYEGGAGIVQLRDKQLSTRELTAVASRLSQMARQYGRLFLVNDRPDVAAAAGADGVHLGPDDLHPRDARRIVGPHALVGVSVGTVREAVELAPYASYLAVGAIYGTATKSDAGKPVGPERISQIAAAAPGKPLVAIGGINAGNLPAVLAAGAISAAVISAVVTAGDIAEAVLQLAQCFSTSA